MVGIVLTLKPDVRCPNEPNQTQQLSDWVAAMRYYPPPPPTVGVWGVGGYPVPWRRDISRLGRIHLIGIAALIYPEALNPKT